MNERQEEAIYLEGYRRGKEEEHKWWSFHCAKCTDADRPKGEWREERNWRTASFYSVCSECGYFDDERDDLTAYNFCPNCGADMRGDDNETD